MAHQFSLPVDIIGAETIRADDGLALSSRNGYLNAEERLEAPQLYIALNDVKSALNQSSSMHLPIIQEIENMAKSQLSQRGWVPDYISVRLRHNLLSPSIEDLASGQELVVLAAAKLGKTRLIDNLEI
jgi:pantoate--beta-alanine ligase